MFLADDFVDGIERQIGVDGMLQKSFMSRTFSFLRSNDLIYGPAIKSYMMGEAPPAFDLLYWNGDGTNLPGKMAVEYLRGLCPVSYTHLDVYKRQPDALWQAACGGGGGAFHPAGAARGRQHSA